MGTRSKGPNRGDATVSIHHSYASRQYVTVAGKKRRMTKLERRAARLRRDRYGRRLERHFAKKRR